MKIKIFILKTLVRLFGAKGFSRMYLATSRSQTYGKFCEKVYGRNLCQANMLDEEQLQTLLLHLNLEEGDTVLDVGCGIGEISEFISDTTKASVLGVDFAYGAIAEANKRVFSKKEKLHFIVGNLDHLDILLEEKYDAIILVDSLYFSRSVDDCILSLKDRLKKDGKLAIFYSSSKKNCDEIETALLHSGLAVSSLDFSSNEKSIWEKTVLVSEELKEDFKKEGHYEIYKSRISEGRKSLNAYQNGLIVRTLFICSRVK